MGIKGIYGEIGPGERTALSKLAVQHFEKSGRPLRIAIDISIWQIQVQSAKGGSNPALRTLYYRLLRLLSLFIQPLFVFDGPKKPTFKRNRRVGTNAASLPDFLAKQLIKLFGFPHHIAPGEAEAECALLQQQGLVDAVLSEDVDTLMFGCGMALRNWSSEGTRGSKSPTHVSVYDATKIRENNPGMDREGMVLIALMSGGDYIPAGIPGCGIRIAREAAAAGFGKGLFLHEKDATGMKNWREKLVHEMQSNESKFFRVKHRSLQIPDDFPNRTVLRYYTRPAVSSMERVEQLRSGLTWNPAVDLPGLRIFVADAFDWTHRSGAKKLVRGLAPALVVHELCQRVETPGTQGRPARSDEGYLQGFFGKRVHFSTDGLPEIRIGYVPLDFVSIDLDAEDSDTEDVGGEAGGIDGEEALMLESGDDAAGRDAPASPSKRRPPLYDPTQVEKVWILDSFVRKGVPQQLKEWEDAQLAPKPRAPTKERSKQPKTKEARWMHT
ncbi:MAG: hypothetical protein M1838_003744 [Thelocarpon superellum]|nr:MAG: hypothetical protein M1838_003744 [Thelocarpon superellum]